MTFIMTSLSHGHNIRHKSQMFISYKKSCDCEALTCSLRCVVLVTDKSFPILPLLSNSDIATSKESS